MSKLRVWHNPQIGRCTPFFIPVESVEEAKKIIDILSCYDLFQLENNIKPDFCNTNGLEMFDEDEQEWVGWYYENDSEYFDDVDDYCRFQQKLQDFTNELFLQIKQIR